MTVALDEKITIMEDCDRCGPSVRASWFLTKTSDGDTMLLSLCNHCLKKYAGALIDQGWETDLIDDGDGA